MYVLDPLTKKRATIVAMLKRIVVKLDERALNAFRELGRVGGRIGGKVRAKKLTAERRRQIAKKAGEARWKARGRSGS